MKRRRVNIENVTLCVVQAVDASGESMGYGYMWYTDNQTEFTVVNHRNEELHDGDYFFQVLLETKKAGVRAKGVH